MGRQRHKRKNSHVVIVTSDAVDVGMKQFRIRPWVLQTIILILCIIIGALIGFIVYEKDSWEQGSVLKSEEQEALTALEKEQETLEKEKAELEIKIAELNETVQILSETVNQKTQNEELLSEQLNRQSIPTECPLTGSATMEEASEGDPMCIFSGTSGSMVVATAGGTVIAVNDDGEYGHNVWVDHGNGYVTIYRNQGEVKVKQGQTVRQGNTLMLIDDENSKLGYQMMKDSAYINPMELLNISG